MKRPGIRALQWLLDTDAVECLVAAAFLVALLAWSALGQGVPW